MTKVLLSKELQKTWGFFQHIFNYLHCFTLNQKCPYLTGGKNNSCMKESSCYLLHVTCIFKTKQNILNVSSCQYQASTPFSAGTKMWKQLSNFRSHGIIQL